MKTKTQRILDVLNGSELTADIIATNTSIDIQNVWMILSRLKNEKRVETTDERKPYVYRSVTSDALLVRLYNIMMTMEPGRELTTDEEHFLKVIEDKLKPKKEEIK